METTECSSCGKEINIPTKADDELTATGLWCECIKKPVCFDCNQSEQHHPNCAFGFPRDGDWFIPKGVE